MLFKPHPSNLRPSDGTCSSRGRPLTDVALFNESQSRIVITYASRHASKILDFLKSRRVPHTGLGEVVKDSTLTIQAAGKPYFWSLEKLRAAHEGNIISLMAWENLSHPQIARIGSDRGCT